MRRVGIADRRPPDRAALLGDQFLQIRIAIIRRRLEFTAERRFGIGGDGGKEELAVNPDHERLVVGDEFRKQRYDEQNQENPERPIAAPVGLEILPAALADRRQRDYPPLGWN